MKRYSGIIVRNEDKYLLCKRNYEGNLPGVWSVPGGHMEDNETPEECARRELIRILEMRKMVMNIWFVIIFHLMIYHLKKMTNSTKL